MKQFINIFLICVIYPTLGMTQTEGVIKTVVIDAGHGGKDPGALGKKSKEKNIALAIALKTGNYIENNFPDVKVVYTRKTDHFIPLHQRAKIANNEKADLFISIHCNSNFSSKIYGTETYVMGLHKTQENLEVAKNENASILQEEDYLERYEGFNPNSPEAYIIFSLYQHANLYQSLDFATLVQKQFKDRVGLVDRGVLQAGFMVLYQTTMPGVLVETGYLSNSNDEKYLLSQDGQIFIASAIYRAFKEYKQANENKNQAESSLIKSSSKNIVFRVQIATSNEDISNHRKFEGLPSLYLYKHEGKYKYCLGQESKLNEAIKLQNELQNKNFKDAFVVAFLNGKRISIKEAQELLKK